VYRQRDSHLGFDTELENLIGGAKGKGTSSSPARPKVPRRQSGADCLVVVKKRSNIRGAKGAGHSRQDHLGQLATGGTEWLWRRAAALTEWHEPCKSRGLRTVLGEARGETPRAYSAMFSRLDYGSLALRPAAWFALLVGADRISIQPSRTFTFGLPTVWSPAPSPNITRSYPTNLKS
jgi:hypothetical protein